MADGAPRAPLRMLVCTHHLYAWRGSEVVAIELVEALREEGVQ